VQEQICEVCVAVNLFYLAYHKLANLQISILASVVHDVVI